MIQQADEELPFDYLKTDCFVPWTHPHDLKRAAQLFSGLSKHVTLCSNDDGTLMFFVAEDEFAVMLRTKVLTHWRYQECEKNKACYRIPFVALESFADAFQDAQSIRIGVVDDYLVFSGKELDAEQEQEVIAWCKYRESSRVNGYINRKASGYVDGLELLKKLIGKEERVTVSSDNFSLWLNDSLLFFEPAPGVQKTERFSITLRRFTLGRVLLRVLRFIAPERKIYVAIAGDVFAIVAPDVKGFIHSIGG